jgi:hypothetical protein
MVQFLNGLWHVDHEQYVIEIDPVDFFTSVYIREIQNRSTQLRLIKTDQSTNHIIDCLFKGLRIIYEYNEGNSTSMQY